MTARRERGGVSTTVLFAAIVVLVVAAMGYYAAEMGGTSSSSSSTVQSTAKRVVAGTVTVGPSSPSCGANEACTEDFSGCSLEFASRCGSGGGTQSCTSQTFRAPIFASGHYSILLPAGEYSITGLSPPCSWSGCASEFPLAVSVAPGDQVVVNVNVETGIG